MNIVLVCLNNFQEYILTNIEQLIRLGHDSIYVITNSNLFHHFDDKVKLINANELDDTYYFYQKTNLDKSFRNGFWTLTSLRFFYIYEFMKKYNIHNVIHLENDVLIYYNCNTLTFDNYIYIPFDSFQRNIASIMYIPSSDVFKKCLDQYNFTKNDMENFINIKNKTGLIKSLPIFPNIPTTSSEVEFVSTNYPSFNCIFDAAAIGQYLGGVDPRNASHNTIGFVNETCVIKYNLYQIIWEDKKPFLVINEQKYKIFNLHIHSKNLVQFV
jgi:hypothetical protein